MIKDSCLFLYTPSRKGLSRARDLSLLSSDSSVPGAGQKLLFFCPCNAIMAYGQAFPPVFLHPRTSSSSSMQHSIRRLPSACLSYSNTPVIRHCPDMRPPSANTSRNLHPLQLSGISKFLIVTTFISTFLCAPGRNIHFSDDFRSIFRTHNFPSYQFQNSGESYIPVFHRPIRVF